MTSVQTRCPVRAEIDADGRWARHVPQYDNGAMVTTDDKGLRSTCYSCGAPIVRKHRKSSWWHALASAPHGERA